MCTARKNAADHNVDFPLITLVFAFSVSRHGVCTCRRDEEPDFDHLEPWNQQPKAIDGCSRM